MYRKMNQLKFTINKQEKTSKRSSLMKSNDKQAIEIPSPFRCPIWWTMQRGPGPFIAHSGKVLESFFYLFKRFQYCGVLWFEVYSGK